MFVNRPQIEADILPTNSNIVDVSRVRSMLIRSIFWIERHWLIRSHSLNYNRSVLCSIALSWIDRIWN
jgi:hypothetical protein